jgi:eukaryotic-like serine/threonine-protein kinase
MKLCPVCESEYPKGERCPKDGAPLIDQAPKDALIGTTVARTYRIEEKIARGGMGTVYRARHLKSGADVAVKVLHVQLQDNPEAVKRFFREAKALAALRHPNIVHFFGSGQMGNGQLYMAMEFLFGQTVDQLVRVQGPLPVDLIATILPQICEAVSAAHAQKVVHRDLTPQNIILARQDRGGERVKLVDFGIAKESDSSTIVTQAGIVMGTPGYLAPEQITGEAATDPRSDIYAIGAVLYFMLCGKRPYTGTNAQSVLSRQLVEPPEAFDTDALGAPAGLRSVIMQAMAKRPEGRYASAKALLSAFSSAIGGEVVTADHFNEKLRAFRRTYPGSFSSDFGRQVPVHRALSRLIWRRRFKRAALALVSLSLLGGGAHLFRHVKWKDSVARVPEHPYQTERGLVLRGVTNERVYIGLSVDLSGPHKEAGRSVFTGVKAAFRTANDDEGGVFQRQLQAIALDDRSDPSVAGQNTRVLLDERNVIALIGALDTQTTGAILPEAVARDAILFAPLSGSAELREKPTPRHLFFFRPSEDEEARAVAQLAKSARPALIEGEGGGSCARTLEKEWPGLAAHPADEADAFFLCANVDAVTTFVSRLSSKPALFVFSQATRSFLEGAKVPPMIRALSPLPTFNGAVAAAAAFRSAMFKYYPEARPNEASFEGFIAGTLFVRGLKAAGNEPDTEKLITAFEAMRAVDIGLGTPVSFSKDDHQGSHALWLTAWDDKGQPTSEALPLAIH